MGSATFSACGLGRPGSLFRSCCLLLSCAGTAKANSSKGNQQVTGACSLPQLVLAYDDRCVLLLHGFCDTTACLHCAQCPTVSAVARLGWVAPYYDVLLCKIRVRGCILLLLPAMGNMTRNRPGPATRTGGGCWLCSSCPRMAW